MNLNPVITWLENGCDPKEAAKELRMMSEIEYRNEELLHMARAALDNILAEKPILGARLIRYGKRATTLGNIRAALSAYEVTE
jgi:hypothetical protein